MKRILSLIIVLLYLLGSFPVFSSEVSVTYEGVFSADLSTGALTEYTETETELVTEREGRYKLTVNASVTKNGIISVSSNGTTVSVMNCYNETSNYFNNTDYVYLTEGTQKIIITVLSGTVRIKSVSLELIFEPAENFAEKINNAKSAGEVYSVLKMSEKAFAVDIDSEMEAIYYKEPVLARLLNRNFKSDKDVINALFASIKKEILTPTVIFTENNIKLTKPKSGNLSLLVRTPKLNSPATIFVVFYENGRLTNVYSTEYTGGSYVTMDLADLVISDAATFKLIYVNDIDGIQPINSENNIFKELYVSQEGDDAFDGSSEKPFKTIRRAKEEVALINSSQTGDIIINVEEGRYFLSETETFSNEHGGKNGYNVIIRGKGENTIISGGTEVTGFTYEGNGIYSANCAEDVQSLYINGAKAKRAKSDFAVEVISVNENVVGVKKDSLGGITDLEGAELFWNCEWVENITPVVSSYSDDDYVYITIPEICVEMGNGTTQTALSKEKRFYIENLKSLLDECGEYYFDKNEKKIYYYPFEDEDMLNADVYVPVTEGLISIEGTDKTNKVTNIVFDNMVFECGAWSMPKDGFIGNQANIFYKDAENTEFVKSQFAAINCDGLKILNCTFANLDSTAIGLIDGVLNASIEGNIIRDVSGSALVVGTTAHDTISDSLELCKNVDISNNVIRRTSQKYMSCPAIVVFYETGITIRHNDIADIPYSGISIGWGWGFRDPAGTGNIDVSHNRMDNVMHSLHDGSFIYTLGFLRKTAIRDNYLTNCKYINSGIYNDSGSSFMKIYKNVILNRAGSKWWYLGRNLTADNTAYKNYVSYDNVEMTGTNNVYSDTVVLGGDYPDEALSVIESSGVTEKYTHLLEKADKDDYKRRSVRTVEHILSGEFGCEAENYSAFSAVDKERITEIDMSVGYLSIAKDEATEYKIEVSDSGEYKIGVVAANGAAENCSISVSVGDISQTVTITPTGSHGAFEKFETDSFSLPKGENTIKITNLYKAFHLDYIYCKVN